MTGGDVGPQASSGVTNGSAGKNATRQPTPLSASRLDGAPRKGTTTSRGWVPTTSMETSRILMATAHWATVPLTFDCEWIDPQASPDGTNGSVGENTPPRRRTFLLASRPDKIPRGGSIATAMSRFWATVHRATALLALQPDETSAHRHPPAQ